MIIKECECCQKKFAPTPKSIGNLYCKSCCKKIKHEILKKRIRQFPFFFWKWNKTSVAEVVNIVNKIQSATLKQDSDDYSKMTCSISFPTSTPDSKGRIFTKEAIKKACQNIEGLPITMHNSDGNSMVVGHIINGVLDGETLNCQGQLYVAPSWTEGKDGDITFKSFSVMQKR